MRDDDRIRADEIKLRALEAALDLSKSAGGWDAAKLIEATKIIEAYLTDQK